MENAKTDVTVKRITVTGTLYEKGTFGTWQKVSSCSNTSAYDYNQKTTVDKYRHIAHFSHDNRLNKLSEQMEAQITNSASQGAEWSGNVEFTAEIKKKIIESLKGTLGISYKETRTTNEAVGYKVVHTVPAGKVGHINLYYKGYKIGGRLTVWTANTSNPSQSKRYATYDVNSTLYPSDTLDIFSESYNANI